MISQEQRCRYRKNPINEVICQLRFPQILKISTQIPADFQEAIRESFPQYVQLKQAPAPKIIGQPGNMQLENAPPVINHQFSTADNVWRVNLTSQFISLSCSRYTRWEDFAQRLDQPLAAFIRIYKPAYFERIGLRYVNFISRNTLDLEGVPFSELIAPCWLGPLSEEDVSESSSTRCSVDAELGIRGGCRAKIHAGPGLVKRGGKPDPEVKFIFDADLFMPGNVQVNHSTGALQTLHSQAFGIFRGAITQRLHEAMEPEYLY